MAQKLVLNKSSTVGRIRLGKTYGNPMVDIVTAEDKLRAGMPRIVEVAKGASTREVVTALEESHGDANVAIVRLLDGTEAVTERERLAGTGGVVRKALGQ